VDPATVSVTVTADYGQSARRAGYDVGRLGSSSPARQLTGEVDQKSNVTDASLGIRNS
jgi:hypothetical protein